MIHFPFEDLTYKLKAPHLSNFIRFNRFLPGVDISNDKNPKNNHLRILQYDRDFIFDDPRRNFRIPYKNKI